MFILVGSDKFSSVLSIRSDCIHLGKHCSFGLVLSSSNAHCVLPSYYLLGLFEIQAFALAVRFPIDCGNMEIIRMEAFNVTQCRNYVTCIGRNCLEF